VAPSAPRRAAPATPHPGLGCQIDHVIPIALDRGDVDGECRRQYTDRSACAASRPQHPSRPHVSVAGLSCVFFCEPRSLARNTLFGRSD
jgi:hypothetical protein